MDSEKKKENGKRKKNNEKSDIWYAILMLAVFSMIFGLAIFEEGVEKYDELVLKEQQLKSNESVYRGAVYVADQQIESMWNVYNTYLSHESKTFIEATRLRAAYNNASNNGRSIETVNSALAFKMLSVNEAFPQLVSAPLAEQTQDKFEKSIDNMGASFNGWMNDVKDYNVARNQFWGRMVGNLGGLPEEYSYYQFDKTKLNVTEILD